MNTSDKIEQIESQISQERAAVDYDTREFTIEYIVDKYLNKIDENDNDFFVPEYQREFVWDEIRQSKFVESIVLGLPVPSMFFAENEDGRCEIVDGSQRVRTLAAFLGDELALQGLETLTELNGLVFSALPPSRQRKIKNTALKILFLSSNATEAVKNDLFERINRGSDLLKDMEKRKGIYRGEFIDFIYNTCAKNELFLKLTPIGKWLVKRQEGEELILRFFALYDLYPQYDTKKQGVARLLDHYVEEKNKSFDKKELADKYDIFVKMLTFVDALFPFGFAKDTKKQVSRVYFEAVSVGAALAIREGASLPNSPRDASKILTDPAFYQNISGKYQTHTPNKIAARINYIKNFIINTAD